MEEEHIPGTAVSVSQDGEIIYEKGFGVRDLETERPVTPETIFGTASVTKSLTALAIMKLEETGKLNIDDPVKTYLPSFNIQGVEPIEDIKIHHLLTHSTGLAPMKRHENYYQFHQHTAYLRNEKHDLLGRPGDFFSYSNDAFLLLGAIIEKVTGRLYRRYMTEEILYPLNMNRSTFSIEEVKKMCNVSIPYIFDKDKERHITQAWPKLGNYEVGGGLRSSVRELMKYGELFLNKGNIDGKQYISNKTLEKMYKPHIQIDPYTFYGYGVRVTEDYHGATLIHHSGGQPGVSSYFGFSPEKNTCVAVLSNVTDATASDIWFEAVNIALGIPIHTKPVTFKNRVGDRDRLDRFIGKFSSKEGQEVTILSDGGDNLTAEVEGEIHPLRKVDEDLLIFQKTDKPIRFFFNDDGQSWAVFLGMRMLLREK